jgi:predicted membrane protein (TIGR00267 family)
MNKLAVILHRQFFALLLGLIDGILTVLTLATGHVMRSGDPVTLSLAVKVAFATSLSGACIYFFSEYSHLRHRLIHAEKELNLSHHGHLATTQLGKQVLGETFIGVIVSSVFNFLGAMLPLGAAVILPKMQWMSIVIALLLLFFLGIAIARLVYGTPVKWVLALLSAGIIVSYVGYKLNVV